MNTTANWINRDLYPFQSRWIEIDHETLHYIDEGQGEVLLFVHGTPEWSFGYRDLIKALRSDYRCIAIDLLGFGLSDKNASSNYTCPAHHHRLVRFIEQLRLTNVTIIANDFGGGISIPYAIDHAYNVKAVVLFNTWIWSLRNDKHFSGPSKIMNSFFGKWLYLSFNFPVNVVMPSAYGDRKLLTKEIHEHYKRALPSGSRTAAYTFAGELMNASDWWESYWQRIDTIASKPILIFWGLKDKFVPPYILEKWKSKLPSAKIITYEDAGHFVQEEKPIEMSDSIRKFVQQM